MQRVWIFTLESPAYRGRQQAADLRGLPAPGVCKVCQEEGQQVPEQVLQVQEIARAHARGNRLEKNTD